MNVPVELLGVAVAAIRRLGSEPEPLGDCWMTTLGGASQIFVTEAPENLGAGAAYDTWIVSLGADGSASTVERFRSTVCRPRAAR